MPSCVMLCNLLYLNISEEALLYPEVLLIVAD